MEAVTILSRICKRSGGLVRAQNTALPCLYLLAVACLGAIHILALILKSLNLIPWLASGSKSPTSPSPLLLLPAIASFWSCITTGMHQHQRMQVDESGWKWMKRIKVDESGRKWMKLDESGWKWMTVDEGGWKWIKVNESGWKWMNEDERGWNGWNGWNGCNGWLIYEWCWCWCCDP